MPCKNPYMIGVIPGDCTRCLPCRQKKAGSWRDRLLLEKSTHSSASFVTLTYRDEEIRDISPDQWRADRPVVGNLCPDDLQKWLKRIRKEFSGPLRFFATGEYGDEKGRPHYHVALFGFPPCDFVRTHACRYSKAKCASCSMVQKTWQMGNIDVGELSEESASYIAGYVTKKLLKESSPCRKQTLDNLGRRPEFVRMSNGGRIQTGGIGATAIKNLVSNGVRTRQRTVLQKSIDAPAVLRRGGSILPLGRYLRRKWREALGRSQETPAVVQSERLSELASELAEFRQTCHDRGTPRCFSDPKALHFEKNKEKIKSLECRAKIFQSRRKL